MTTFQDLGVSAPILKALDAEGYTKPTPIQMQALPIVAKGKDLIGPLADTKPTSSWFFLSLSNII